MPAHAHALSAESGVPAARNGHSSTNARQTQSTTHRGSKREEARRQNLQRTFNARR